MLAAGPSCDACASSALPASSCGLLAASPKHLLRAAGPSSGAAALPPARSRRSPASRACRSPAQPWSHARTLPQLGHGVSAARSPAGLSRGPPELDHGAPRASPRQRAALGYGAPRLFPRPQAPAELRDGPWRLQQRKMNPGRGREIERYIVGRERDVREILMGERPREKCKREMHRYLGGKEKRCAVEGGNGKMKKVEIDKTPTHGSHLL
ncbi:hypothetical protein PVAP13_5NG142162 [Panicum virgatum]|uniref:Uncharacterized protein n=1 Tax=Panicum virgatum TaxID=38727 RepID=A0A8T0RM71_PANVG|nr:hypothetical protein PVAP13_5NG142162 [Panicum virgatum]